MPTLQKCIAKYIHGKDDLNKKIIDLSLSEGDKNILKQILKNDYEISLLNVLTLYEVETISDTFDSFAFNELIEYKQNNLDKLEERFNFDNLVFLKSTVEDKVTYYAIRNEDIKLSPIIYSDETINEEFTTIFRQTNADNSVIYFKANKNYIWERF